MSVVLLGEDRVRKKIVENRKQMGYKRCDVVIQMQLFGFDISYEMYKNIENGRRNMTVVEFLFLTKFLNIDISVLMPNTV
ncbi:MAG: hypothetical protein J6B12_05830 [Clostridia bacterium]|nr:hypothetical protein [Clostridia bacterium]